MLKHRGKIIEVIELSKEKMFYALVFQRTHRYFDATANCRKSKKYNFIIGCFGKNAQKILSAEIRVGLYVLVIFRVESYVKIHEGSRFVAHSVIAEDIYDIKAMKQSELAKLNEDIEPAF